MIVPLVGVAFLKEVRHEFWSLDTEQQIMDQGNFLSKKVQLPCKNNLEVLSELI